MTSSSLDLNMLAMRCCNMPQAISGARLPFMGQILKMEAHEEPILAMSLANSVFSLCERAILDSPGWASFGWHGQFSDHHMSCSIARCKEEHM